MYYSLRHYCRYVEKELVSMKSLFEGKEESLRQELEEAKRKLQAESDDTRLRLKEAAGHLASAKASRHSSVCKSMPGVHR